MYYLLANDTVDDIIWYDMTFIISLYFDTFDVQEFVVSNQLTSMLVPNKILFTFPFLQGCCSEQIRKPGTGSFLLFLFAIFIFLGNFWYLLLFVPAMKMVFFFFLKLGS